uniref:Bark protein-like protein n=1 Tax=Thuja occidentalis TaxID=3317 RepID=Q5RZ94_THUOC|nr:bark protein-like protein [Thuja occidentalis]
MAFYKISSVFFIFCFFLIALPFHSYAEIPQEIAERIERVNKRGEHYGLVVSTTAELEVVLEKSSGTFRPDKELPTIDISGRRFHVGDIGGRRTLLVMCGRGMVNAAQTTQLMVTLFRVRAVVQYGRGSSANPHKLNIGDVAIPRQFAHTGLLYWEKFGVMMGDSIVKLQISHFPDYMLGNRKGKLQMSFRVVYPQREEIYSVRGKAEGGKAPSFWLNVDNRFLNPLGHQLEKVELEKCMSKEKESACLQEQPRIKRVERGSSSNFYVNNEAYRNFLRDQAQCGLPSTLQAPQLQWRARARTSPSWQGDLSRILQEGLLMETTRLGGGIYGLAMLVRQSPRSSLISNPWIPTSAQL